MGDWPRLVNLRRCARGYIVDSGESTNTTLALFNNSASSELILVWQLVSGILHSVALSPSYQQGLALSVGGTVAAIVPGDAPPPGVLTSGDSPTAFDADFLPSAGFTPYWPATFPFAVLQPGWSLAIQNVAGNPTGALDASFFWEAILPKYFDRFYTHQLLEIELALKG